MLILTRSVGKSLIIGDEVTVTVLSVKGKQVRIGIKAPKEVAVHREEIYGRIKKDKEAAALVNHSATIVNNAPVVHKYTINR